MHVMEDATLPLIATVTLAQPSVPVHVLRYNPALIRHPEYLVCFQCGFIIRAYEVPPDQRYEVVSNERGRREAASLITKHLRKKGKLPLPQDVLASLHEQLLNGLIVQLRSIPIGLRIDRWLYDEYPALKELQKEAAMKQLQDNTTTLRPDIAAFAPNQIHRPSLAMNAAYAEFWARLYEEPQLSLPYKATGQLESGLQLLSLLDAVPSDAAHDRQLIDRWAESLGINNWYTCKAER